MKDMNIIAMYPHPGSMNHGCEAIVRSTNKILKDSKLELFSYSIDSDKKFGVDECATLVQTNEVKRFSLYNAYFHLHKAIFHNRNAYYRVRYAPVLETKSDVVLSIGGDNYCYGIPKDMIYINNRLRDKGKKIVLWGCSVSPEVLDNLETLNDLRAHALITARESLTYEALVNAGLKNVILCADPAFQLEKKQVKLPEWFSAGNTIGINVSPMVLRYQNAKISVMDNYFNLIEYILQKTNYNIALIPHVTGVMNDDRDTLNLLYEKYKVSKRIGKIDINGCEVLKGYISQCRFFIGARTHATIAAYSTCVPTLVVGYSIKAKGIAKDIFGTFENYVVSAQEFKTAHDLKNAFMWIENHENQIRTHLTNFMPEYIQGALQAEIELERIVDND